MAHKTESGDCPLTVNAIIRKRAKDEGISLKKAIEITAKESGISKDTISTWVWPRKKNGVKNHPTPKSSAKNGLTPVKKPKPVRPKDVVEAIKTMSDDDKQKVTGGIEQIIKQSKALRDALAPLVGNLDNGYDTATMVELGNEIGKLDEVVSEFYCEVRDRWPRVRLEVEQLGEKLVLFEDSIRDELNTLCPECFKKLNRKYNDDWLTVHTHESLLKDKAVCIECDNCFKVLFTHCNQPPKPAKTKEAIYFDKVWAWAPWNTEFYFDEGDPEKIRNLNSALANWKGILGLGPTTTGWFNFKTGGKPSKLEFFEIIKQTERYYYIKNRYSRLYPQRLSKPKTFRIDRIKLVSNGWAYCKPLRRVVYRNQLLAKAFVAYIPGGEKKMLAELGIDLDAPPEKIKRQWRDLVKKYHPDHGGDPEKFRMINETFKPLI